MKLVPLSDIPEDWIAFQSVGGNTEKIEVAAESRRALVYSARSNMFNLPEFVEIHGGGGVHFRDSRLFEGWRDSGCSHNYVQDAGAPETVFLVTRPDGRTFVPLCEIGATDTSRKTVMRFLAAPSWIADR